MKVTMASVIKKLAETFDPNIEFTTRSYYGGPELVYVLSKHKEPLQDLTGSKTLTPRHVKALKALGFTFKQQGVPEKVL